MFKRGNFEKQINNLPDKVIWCKNCTISNQRPRIVFHSDGICSACKNANYKNNIDWAEREVEFLKLLSEYRSGEGKWDILVPSSGGKDSGYVAHILKYKYKMNPLTVTWSPLRYTNIGIDNFNALNDSGFVNLKCSQNGIIHRKIARYVWRSLETHFMLL